AVRLRRVGRYSINRDLDLFDGDGVGISAHSLSSTTLPAEGGRCIHRGSDRLAGPGRAVC
ncbi:MAG TPA: hypothetical protein VF898_09250, partial [Chloroflexota bacterium]